MDGQTIESSIEPRIKELEQEFNSLAESKGKIIDQITAADNEVKKINTRQLQIQGAIDELKKLSMPPKKVKK